jgi:hypothetical protein
MTQSSEDERYLVVNAPKVACQTFDGEVLLIHFERGHYYSATGCAARLIELVELGLSESEVGRALMREYGLENDRARQVASRFLEQLISDELFTVAADPRADERVAPSSVRLAPGTTTKAFEEPLLSKYTDLEDLLVLDPVHDVMMTGWPAAH